MLQKLVCGLLCAGALFSTPALATTTYPLLPGFEYKLQPDTPVIVENTTFWKIKVTCTIHTPDESDELVAKVLNKKGELDGQPVHKGEIISKIVSEGTKVTLIADSAAKVELTNKGKSAISAICIPGR